MINLLFFILVRMPQEFPVNEKNPLPPDRILPAKGVLYFHML